MNIVNTREEVKRSYKSVVRRDRARATQRAIVDAGRALFAEHGYAATSIDAVATAAQVSRATVFNSVGGKPALLRRAYEIAVRGDEDPTPLGRRPEALRILAEPDPHELLAAYAGVCAEFAPRLARIYEVARVAADTDPEARALWQTITEERRTGGARVIAALVERGKLRADLDAQSATDVLWVLNDPGLFQMLVESRGWTPGRFHAWLADAMKAELLPPCAQRPEAAET